MSRQPQPGRAGFVEGVRLAASGLRLIAQPGVRVFVAIPLAINVVLFTLALYGASSMLDSLMARYLGSWPEWIQSIAWGLFAILAAVIVFFTFSVVANLVASPFNGMLSEAVERMLDPAQPALEFSWRRVLADLRRTVFAELRKLLYIVLRALPLLLLSVIPGLNALAPPLWLLFGAWMLCLEYLDCPLGNHSVFFPRVVDEMRANRRLALGFGATMTLMTMVPLLNYFAMPAGVAGATRLYVRHIAAGDRAAGADGS
ncbi:MAG: sulfate transporter CysZ [Gammaproteobacteria bacterium]